MLVVEMLGCAGKPNEENPIASPGPAHCGLGAAALQPSGLGGRWGRPGPQEADSSISVCWWGGGGAGGEGCGVPGVSLVDGRGRRQDGQRDK